MRAVVCPMTPLLLSGAAGRADPLADLRAACVAAVRELAEASDRILVLAPEGIPGAPARYHPPAGPGGRSLGALVAAHLLGLSVVRLPVDVRPVRGPTLRDEDGRLDGAGLLVLGDGAAGRSARAPGYLDERAFAFDDWLARGLSAGDGVALGALDQELAAGLLVTGRHSFAALGRAVPRAEGELRRREDPFGVSYFLAVWR